MRLPPSPPRARGSPPAPAASIRSRQQLAVERVDLVEQPRDPSGSPANPRIRPPRRAPRRACGTWRRARGTRALGRERGAGRASWSPATAARVARSSVRACSASVPWPGAGTNNRTSERPPATASAPPLGRIAAGTGGAIRPECSGWRRGARARRRRARWRRPRRPSSLRRRVSTLPRSSTTSSDGFAGEQLRAAAQRGGPDAERAPGSRSPDQLLRRPSLRARRRRHDQPSRARAGGTALPGTSFAECTATSISPATSAASIGSTQRDLSPIASPASPEVLQHHELAVEPREPPSPPARARARCRACRSRSALKPAAQLVDLGLRRGSASDSSRALLEPEQLAQHLHARVAALRRRPA